MKKLVFGALAAALLSVPLCALAQERFAAQSENPAQSENFAARPAVEANHSVSVNLPFSVGVHYAYELPFARKATIVGRLGMDFATGGGGWGFGIPKLHGEPFYLNAAPSIDIEPRFYYGLDRRARNGRSTDKNAGSFVALQVKNIMPFGHISNGVHEIGGVTYISPMWGFRRVWNTGWLFELTAGFDFVKEWDYYGFAWYPSLNFRFGYSF